MNKCNFPNCSDTTLPFSLYCKPHHEKVLTEAKEVALQNEHKIVPNETRNPSFDLKESNIAGTIRSIRLEIADSVRLDGQTLAANMLSSMPVLMPDQRLKVILAAQNMLQSEFSINPSSDTPSLHELLGIEQFFQTCLEITKSLVGAKKTKLGIKTKDAIIAGTREGKERERKVQTKASLDKVKVTKVSGEKVFSHTALDMVKDIFYVSHPLDKDAAKLMKKLCDRILVSSDLDELDKDSMIALFDKPLFAHLKKFVTFK